MSKENKFKKGDVFRIAQMESMGLEGEPKTPRKDPLPNFLFEVTQIKEGRIHYEIIECPDEFKGYRKDIKFDILGIRLSRINKDDIILEKIN